MNGNGRNSKNWDMLNEKTVKRALGKIASEMTVIVHPVCDSTNLEARRRVLSGADAITLILAEEQTAGRGRLGRQFHSPKGAGLYLSLLFPLVGSLPSAVSLTCASSVAVMRAIRSTVGLQTEIKWVNDLLLNGKKVCGILAEAITVGDRTQIVIGVGINLRPIEFPPALREIAGSLGDETVTRSALAAEVARELMRVVRDPADLFWLEEYRNHSAVVGKPIRWIEDGTERFGVADGIEENGALRVTAENGTSVLLQTGEISVRTL